MTLIKMHLAATPASLTTDGWYLLGQKTEGFSGSDLSNCTADAMFEPIRELEKNTHWKLNEGNCYLKMCTCMWKNCVCAAVELNETDSSLNRIRMSKVEL